MKHYVVVSATGKDRPGFVNSVSHAIHETGGNIELQRSMRMADEYALLILFSVDGDAARAQAAITALNGLNLENAHLHAREALSVSAQSGSVTYGELEAAGADQSGLIDAVTLILFKKGINIESMDYDTESAPMTGETLFRMTARLALARDINVAELRAALRDVSDRYNFDVMLRHPAD